MDLKGLQDLWNKFLAFLDRSFQWLMYLFDGDREDNTWPPEDYPM